MVNSCSFCGKEIDRLIFCKPSHKVMYHRKGGKPISETSDAKREVENFKKTKLPEISNKFTSCSKHRGVLKASCGCI